MASERHGVSFLQYLLYNLVSQTQPLNSSVILASLEMSLLISWWILYFKKWLFPYTTLFPNNIINDSETFNDFVATTNIPLEFFSLGKIYLRPWVGKNPLELEIQSASSSIIHSQQPMKLQSQEVKVACSMERKNRGSCLGLLPLQALWSQVN